MALTDIYPLTPLPDVPVKFEDIFDIQVSEYGSIGYTQRKVKSARYIHRITLTYRNLKWNEMRDLYEFYKRQAGDVFYFLSPIDQIWFYEYAGRGDGSTKVFSAPAKDIYITHPCSGATGSLPNIHIEPVIYYKVYTADLDGSNKVLEGTSEYNYVAGVCLTYNSGTYGEVEIHFNTAPATNKIILISFVGKLYIPVRYEKPNLSFQVFAGLIQSVGINLIQETNI